MTYTKITESRDNVLDCIKGFGIILVVLGHSGCPELLYKFIYLFHMPLFFIASGWFIKECYLNSKKHYFFKKVKGLYFPFLKYSLIFLLLHNFLYESNLTQKEPYGVNDFLFHFLNIVFRMSGYEEDILGTFWFMRALFIGQIAFVMIVYLFYKRIKDYTKSVFFTIGTFLIMALVMSYLDIHIPFYPQGGYRDIMAIVFIGIGCLLNKFITRIKTKNIWIISIFSILLFFATFCPTELYQEATLTQCLTIFITGVIGFLLVYMISSNITSEHLINILSYIGQNTFVIFALHFISFKCISLAKVYYYHLPFEFCGQHPIISINNSSWWFLYFLAGLSIPIMTNAIYIKMSNMCK